MRFLILILCFGHVAYCQIDEVRLFDFENSTCTSDSDGRQLKTRIVSRHFENNVLTVRIAGTAHCCVGFKALVTKTANGLIDLSFSETGAPCECFCCYEFTYRLTGDVSDSTSVTFRGEIVQLSSEAYETFPIEFRVVDGDTVNYFDRYGLGQGKFWVTSKGYKIMTDGHETEQIATFGNGGIKERLVKEKVQFVLDGVLRHDYSDFNKYFEYYETGKLKRECSNDQQTMNNSYLDGSCKEWDENGTLLYIGPYR